MANKFPTAQEHADRHAVTATSEFDQLPDTSTPITDGDLSYDEHMALVMADGTIRQRRAISDVRYQNMPPHLRPTSEFVTIKPPAGLKVSKVMVSRHGVIFAIAGGRLWQHVSSFNPGVGQVNDWIEVVTR